MNNLIENSSNVIGLNPRLGKYRYIHERVKATDTLPNGHELTIDRMVISVEKNENGIKKKKTHPITEFLYQSVKRKGGMPSIKTQKVIANFIVNFLNFVMIENYPTYRLKSTRELRFEHAEDYLTIYGQTGRKGHPVKASTVRRCESHLTRFYFFLAKKKLLNHITLNDFEYKEYVYEDLQRHKEPESPFINVEYPKENNGDALLIHNIPKELIVPFILTAFSHTPRIALGVAFQCFGGLRAGEVVNINTAYLSPSVDYGMYGFTIKIKNQNFRPELKDVSGEATPKKERTQNIFPFNGHLLKLLYKAHINSYKATDGSNALFVNNDGKAMAKFTYEREFRKLKKTFLSLLLNSKDPDLITYGLELSSARWSTHIGRGIFSNLIASDATNVLQVMNARGDSNPTSSLSYLNNTDTMLGKLRGNYDDMYEKLLEERTKVHDSVTIKKRYGILEE